jgi:hypothetical protein
VLGVGPKTPIPNPQSPIFLNSENFKRNKIY